MMNRPVTAGLDEVDNFTKQLDSPFSPFSPSMASRHLARSIAMQALFEWDFNGKKPDVLAGIVERNKKEFGPGLEEEYSFIDGLIAGTVEHLPKIDKIIATAAPE